MHDDQISAILRQANPWWITAANNASPTGWVTEHRLLRERRRYDLGYRTQVLADVTADPVDDKLVVLTGPRRVGKSIALLDTAATLCARKDFDPRQLIHIPADGFSAQDLARAFTLGRQQTRSVDRPSPRRRVWLLDEVSGIAGWTTILKRLRDQTSVGDDDRPVGAPSAAVAGVGRPQAEHRAWVYGRRRRRDAVDGSRLHRGGNLPRPAAHDHSTAVSGSARTTPAASRSTSFWAGSDEYAPSPPTWCS